MKSKCYSVTRESTIEEERSGDRLCPIEQQRGGRRPPRGIRGHLFNCQCPFARGEIGIAVVESETIIAQSSGQRGRVWITEKR